MPQTNSAKKALRQTNKRTAKNQVIKKDLEYLLRDFKKALDGEDKAKIEEATKKLNKAIDKAAQKRIIKKQAAARKKSRVMKNVNAKIKK
jgi:small subunit ribosomal protein S20